jgi:glucose/arabinose dehydrogenase
MRYLGELGERIRDVTVGPDGYVYLVTDSGNGRVLRVRPVVG